MSVLSTIDVGDNAELVIKKIFPDEGKTTENCVITTNKAEATEKAETLRKHLSVNNLQTRREILLKEENSRIATILGAEIVTLPA